MSDNSLSEISTTCCIVGGGPAGMMTGFLLARAGVDVVVVEKHGDFLRDFRGDTVHPSTLELMHELGLLDDLLKQPHQEVTELGAQIGEKFYRLADFSKLGTQCKFLAFMPQWDFLNFLSGKARQYPTFQLLMNCQVTDLIEQDNRILGVKVTTESGERQIRAKLTIGADGRSSVVRERAGLQVMDIGAPMDVLWMGLSKKGTDPPQTLGRIKAGAILIMLNREEYWQCGFVIPKGKFEEYKTEGLEKFHSRLLDLAPFLADRIQQLDTWDKIKLLTVKVDRLKQWHRDGLLCIGDAAHAMSPIGGVGINLAIQDAVAASNILFRPLLEHRAERIHLQEVESRRTFPTVMTQRLQVFLQTRFVKQTLQSTKPLSAPLLAQIMSEHQLLRTIPARVIGIGFRPEHIHSPDSRSAK